MLKEILNMEYRSFLAYIKMMRAKYPKNNSGLSFYPTAE